MSIGRADIISPEEEEKNGLDLVLQENGIKRCLSFYAF
jgi:hypothetical protein